MVTFIDVLLADWWIAPLLMSFLFLADHYLTVQGAKLMQGKGDQPVVHEKGYELNPKFEKEVAEFKWFTRKHAFALAGMVLLIAACYFFYRDFYELIVGGFVLQWVFLDLGHFRNMFTIGIYAKPGSVKGRVVVSYWASQRAASINWLAEAIFFACLWLMSLRIFFLGGTLACLFQAFRHHRLANRFETVPVEGTQPNDQAEQG